MVSGPENRLQSELELMSFSLKSGNSIVEQSGANRRPDVGREIHIGLHYVAFLFLLLFCNSCYLLIRLYLDQITSQPQALRT